MWFNYFLTTIRSLQKNTFYVLANLISLGVAFALTIIGYFNYEFNHSFNRFFPEVDQVYKVNSIREGFPDQYGMGVVPLPLASHLAGEIGAENVARLQYASVVLRKDEELVRKKVAYVDPSFLQIFPFPDVQGNATGLSDLSSIVITRGMALSMFGRTDVVGEQLQFQDDRVGEKQYLVSAVLDDFPENISFRFDLIMLFDGYKDHEQIDRIDWASWVDGTFVRADNQSLGNLTDLMNGYLEIQNDHNQERRVVNYRLDSIVDWPGFESRLYQSRFVGVLHPASVMGTISSAIFILLLACFNFINISISLSGKRLKEIAMRKVLGGSKRSIINQFMIENVWMVLTSILLAIIIAVWLIPSYNALFDYNIVQFRFLNWGPFLIFSVVLFTIVVLIAGGYPALYISRFPSLTIFREKARIGGSGKLLGILVALQFVICFYNVFSLMVFVENAAFQETLDRGYNVTHVLNIPVDGEEQYKLLEAELATAESVRSLGATQHLIGFHSTSKKVSVEGDELELASLKVGKQYLETMQVRLVKGRMLRKGDVGKPVILVNALMERALGGEVIGRNIKMGSRDYKIVGVLEDFNLRTILLDNEIKPAVVEMVGGESVRYFSMRGDFVNDQEMLKEAETVWYSLFPNQLFEGFLQENVIRPLRQTNHIVISINSFVAVMAILISVLGLYSTISLAIGRRMKELGIRKVLGATVWQITYVLNSRLMLILLASSLVGLVGGYWFIADLLDIIYAYHINISPRHFVVPVLLILVIVLASIGWKVGKAVKENPVKQLRTE